MIGAFLNALGILLGSFFGLAVRAPLSARLQHFFKSALGAFTVLFGLRLVYENTGGPFTTVLKQLLLALLAFVLGNWIGKLLRLQKMSNRLGRHAAALVAAAQKNPPGRPADGFHAATILFCAAPLGLIGAVVDGLGDFYFLLALKAVMDGLAMVSFMRLFSWTASLAAVPVLLFLDGLALTAHYGALPWLAAHHLTGSVNTAAGLVVASMSLVIFEVRRVELANYLPALAVAPLLTWWLG